MKKIVHFIFYILILSCARQPEKNEDNNASDIEFIEPENTFVAPTEASYTLFIKQKLQDRLDREHLFVQHPEFSTEDSLTPIFVHQNDKEKKEIQKIVLIESPERLNDSVTKLITQIHFADNKTDTVLAYIRTSVITVNNTAFKTSDITFEKHIPDQK